MFDRALEENELVFACLERLADEEEEEEEEE